MLCANSQTRLRVLAGLGLLALGVGVGCARTPEAPFTAEVRTTAPASTMVFSSAPVRNWHASNTGEPGVGLIAADRYEFSRNDARLTPQTRGPVLATRQWPEPPRPIERPVRFWRWQQR